MAYFSYVTAFGGQLMVEFEPAVLPTRSESRQGCTYVFHHDRLIGITIAPVPAELQLKPGVQDGVSSALQSFLATIEWPEGEDYQPVITGGYQIVDIVESEVIEGTHLHRCVVTDGSRQYTLVCGAANAHVGQRSILAHSMTRLSSGAILTPTTIHSIPSSEMLCSFHDLGSPQLATKRGIIELDETWGTLGQRVTREEVEAAYAKRARG